MAKKPEQDDIAREKVGYSLPSDLVRAVKRISFEESAAIQDVVADALKELVVRYIAQRRPVEPVDLSGRVLDLDWGVVSASKAPPGAPGETKDVVVLPPSGNIPDDPEAIELHATFTILKRRNPILAQALTLAIVAGSREGSDEHGQSIRTPGEIVGEAVRNVQRTLERLGADSTGAIDPKSSAGGSTSTPAGTGSTVKRPKAG